MKRKTLVFGVILLATAISIQCTTGRAGQGQAAVDDSDLQHDDAMTITANLQSAEPYELDFSTYVGGSDKDEMGDLAVDSQGNVYVTGWTWSADFPTTPGAYDTTFDGGPGGIVDTDAYVIKFGPTGNLVWSTFLGGPNTDLTYSIAVDSQGYVYVAGRGGRDFPTTPGAFQPSFNGFDNDIYGEINAIIVKLEPDGSDVAWSSYFGTAGGIRDLDIDRYGDVYVASGYGPSDGQVPFPAGWFADAFQNSPQGDKDVVLAKIASDGSQILWATYLGGSDDDSPGGSIAVDENGSVYVATVTESVDIPTPNGYDQTYNGKGVAWGGDTYVAKLAPDGSSIVWGTYLGGTDSDSVLGKHAVAVTASGMVYVASATVSIGFPTTSGAFQPTFGGRGSGTCPPWGAIGDWAITKLTTDGQLVSSTFVGGRDGDGGEGIALDADGNAYLSGQTCSDDFPVTASAFQTNYNGNSDAVFFKLSSDLSQLRYSFYMGTSSIDVGRAVGADSHGIHYLGGITDSMTWPTQNAFQNSYAGGSFDAIVARFKLTPTRPTNVAVKGPTAGLVQVGYAFTAMVSPVTATLPMTYTWEATNQAPVTQTGGLSDTVTFAWDVTGIQTVSVTATNGAGTVTDTQSITIAQEKKTYLPLILRSWLGVILLAVQSLFERR